MKLQGKHSLMLAVVVAIAATSTARAEDVTVKLEDGSDWTIKITPGPSASPAPVEGKAAQYSAVYNSIPFNRAECDADPSYRHDATMEFLFDQLRPGTKVMVGGNVDVDNYMRRPVNSGWGYLRGPGLGYGVGYGLGYYPGFIGSATVIRQVP